MASKEQYEFFRSLYEEEEKTSLELEGRAKVYLGIISAFLVTIFLKTDDVLKSATSLHIPFSILLILALFLSIAVLCVTIALRIRAFEAVNDGIELIEEYDGKLPPDEIFFEDRIADLAVASNRNRKLNNQTSVLLAYASYLLIAGMLLVLIIAVISVWRFRNGGPTQPQSSQSARVCFDAAERQTKDSQGQSRGS